MEDVRAFLSRDFSPGFARAAMLDALLTGGPEPVQRLSISPAEEGTGLRLTTARFYSPNGHNLAKVGVKPDISVEAPKRDDNLYRRPTRETISTDPDIIKALEQLRGRLAG